MQLVPPLTRDPRVIAREAPASAHLPYLTHIDDRTVETNSGLLLQVIQLDGFLFETADTEEINYRSQLRAAMLQAIGSPRFAIYHHICRRKAEVALGARFGDEFSQSLDQRWRERLAAREMYVNDLFLTVVRRPMTGRTALLDRARGFVARTFDGRGGEFAGERRALDSAVKALMASLGRYGPRVLAIRETDTGVRSEPLELLSYLYNSEMRPIVLPHGPIADHLPFRRVSFGQDAFELAPIGTDSRKYGAILSIKDYPAQTFPGMFDELNRTAAELTVTQSFSFLERDEALGRMSLALRRMRSTDDDAISLRHDLVKAKDEVAAGRAAFGEHHTSIALRAADFDTLDQQVAETTAILADLGITAVREDMAVEPAFWAQFPGNFSYIARKAVISSRNFAGLASLHNFPVGRAAGNHWGEAVTLFETTAAGPYFFNFHRGDLGNFTIIGPSGSGKTVVLNFILAQARKFSPRIVFFDKDRGAELFIRAIGGEYDRLRPGKPSGLNPLQLEDTAENRRFLLEWIALLVGGLDTGETQSSRRRSTLISWPRASTGACAISSSSFPAMLGQLPATSPLACVHGGVMGSGPGCSTMNRTGPTSLH